jgi:DNA-directed RNA polymerase subunit K
MIDMMWPKDELTRFEVARLIGARALQISLGAPVFAKVEEIKSPIQVAKMEFKNKLLPITIKRKLPNDEEIIVEIKAAIGNWLASNAGEV